MSRIPSPNSLANHEASTVLARDRCPDFLDTGVANTWRQLLISEGEPSGTPELWDFRLTEHTFSRAGKPDDQSLLRIYTVPSSQGAPGDERVVAVDARTFSPAADGKGKQGATSRINFWPSKKRLSRSVEVHERVDFDGMPKRPFPENCPPSAISKVPFQPTLNRLLSALTGEQCEADSVTVGQVEKALATLSRPIEGHESQIVPSHLEGQRRPRLGRMLAKAAATASGSGASPAPTRPAVLVAATKVAGNTDEGVRGTGVSEAPSV